MAPMNKKRKFNTAQPEEIKFDDEARNDYLGGFHKRKVARAEHARAVAAKQEKEDKVRERKQLREQRQEDLSKHIAEYNAELRKQNPDLGSDELSEAEVEDGEGETFEGFGETENVGGQEDEYVDEDKYTTVTVEAMGDGAEDSESEDRVPAVSKVEGDTDHAKVKKRMWSKNKPADGKPKPKKRQFRYESKAERKETRNKQKAKNSKAASARRAR